MKWLHDLTSLVYPRVCSGCGNSLFRHEEWICNRCYTTLPKTNFHASATNPVQKIFYGRADVRLASSFLFFQKKSNVQKMLHALKYRSRPEIGHLLGKWYGADLKENGAFKDCTCIVPVPLHDKRRRKRGYNQSEHFARGLAEELDIPVRSDLLFKTHFTESQTYKTREERCENTLNSFDTRNDGNLRGQHVLLVDDVITTGATTEACVLQLQKSPEVTVSVASIAYTL
jgi:ComF family protein